MPGTVIERDELDQMTVTFNQAMRGYLKVLDLVKVDMCARVEPVSEKLLDIAAAVLPRRQADAMYHDQFDTGMRRPGFVVGRANDFDRVQPTGIIDTEAINHC